LEKIEWGHCSHAKQSTCPSKGEHAGEFELKRTGDARETNCDQKKITVGNWQRKMAWGECRQTAAAGFEARAWQVLRKKPIIPKENLGVPVTKGSGFFKQALELASHDMDTGKGEVQPRYMGYEGGKKNKRVKVGSTSLMREWTLGLEKSEGRTLSLKPHWSHAKGLNRQPPKDAQ